MNRPATTATALAPQEQTVPDDQTAPATDTVLRVVKGNPSPEELAVVIALLRARMAAAPDDDTGTAGPGPATARWRRPERRSQFLGPRTWHRP